MIAGKLRYRIEVFEPVKVEDAFGSETVDYVSRDIIWAQRQKMVPSLHVEVGEGFSDYRSEWVVHYQHRVTDNWRIKDDEGIVHVVINHVLNVERGIKTLVCDRLNE